MNEQISKFLQQRIDAGDFPSAVYLVAEKGEIVFTDALGYAVVEPEKIEARVDTIYDLASLTKVLVTGLVCARLVERKDVELDQIIEHYLPELIEFGNANDSRSVVEYDCLDVLVSELLVHRSGYQAWKPFYLLVDTQNDNKLFDVMLFVGNKLPPQFEPSVIYSDLNFIMLGGLIEKLFGVSLDRVIEKGICNPLSLKDTLYNPPDALRSRIAASEQGNGFEREMCIERGYIMKNPVTTVPGSDPGNESQEIRNPQSAFRNYQIWGEVHDNNAYFMGGVAGHAGLFSTAEEVFKIALQFLPNYTQLLKPETCELFRTNFTPGMNEHRSFAFQLATTPDSTAGTKMSPESFGHTGFTGTSLWIDPVKERIFVLLTNRTHNHPLPFVNINSVRRKFHDIAIDLLNER